MVQVLSETLSGHHAEEVFAVVEQMGAFHPTEPVWYLPLIGVEPEEQGRGYGAAMLRDVLELCDRDGVAAYLESSNPANLTLYRRHGFEQTGVIQAGSSPEMYPMLRRPR